jgi:hypothetical protein
MNIDEFESFVHRGLAGQLRLDNVVPTIFDIPLLSPEQKQVWHQLYHFLMDEDLRNEDTQHDEMKRRNILEMLNTLRAMTQDS